jgi:hypothetical protein
MNDTETASNPQTPATANFAAFEQQVQALFALEKITLKDIEGLNKPERKYLAQVCTEILQELRGAERERFLDQIDEIMPPTTKSDIWECNHTLISNAVARLMEKNGLMPTKIAIAEETGLSRQTVIKHFAAYKRHPDFIAQTEQFKFMTPQVLANVFRFAKNGDMRAARLYFEIVGAANNRQANTVVNEQNNYIQINNTILSQENLKQLTAEQLNQIENIITKKELKRIS